MAKSKKLPTNNNNEIEAEVYTSENNNPNTQIFNQQNNFHLSQQIDLNKLANLSTKDGELANRVMSLYEKQQEHNINIDSRIINLEEKEQEIRKREIPYQRIFAFLTLIFAILLSIVSLGCAVYLAMNNHEYLAGTAITIPFTVAVSNLIGRSKGKEPNVKPKRK